MHKILLILEDYSELMFIQIVLKKLGFDVDGIQNPHAISDRLMVFRPSVVIYPEEGKRIRKDLVDSALQPYGGIKRVRLSSAAKGIDSLDEGSCRIRSPIQPQELIEALAKVCQMDSHQLVEKYKKFRRQLSAETGSERVLEQLEEIGEQIEVSEDRSRRYDKFLAQAKDTVVRKFDPRAVSRQNQELKAKRTMDEDVEEKINDERHAFTKKLFKG